MTKPDFKQRVNELKEMFDNMSFAAQNDPEFPCDNDLTELASARGKINMMIKYFLNPENTGEWKVGDLSVDEWLHEYCRTEMSIKLRNLIQRHFRKMKVFDLFNMNEHEFMSHRDIGITALIEFEELKTREIGRLNQPIIIPHPTEEVKTS